MGGWPQVQHNGNETHQQAHCEEEEEAAVEQEGGVVVQQAAKRVRHQQAAEIVLAPPDVSRPPPQELLKLLSGQEGSLTPHNQAASKLTQAPAAVVAFNSVPTPSEQSLLKEVCRFLQFHLPGVTRVSAEKKKHLRKSCCWSSRGQPHWSDNPCSQPTTPLTNAPQDDRN